MRCNVILTIACLILAGPTLAAKDSSPVGYIPAGVAYYPAAANYVTIYYSNDVPFAAVEGDSSSCLLTLTTERIGRAAYLRLWLLCRNKAAAPLLLEPLKIAKATVNAGDRIVELLPVPPDEIARHADSILQAQRSAGAESSRPSADTARLKSVLMDAWEPDAGPHTGAFLNEAYRNSRAGALLRKHTVFRDRGLAGYLYFRLPQLTLEQAQRVTLLLSLPGEQKLLRFSTQESE